MRRLLPAWQSHIYLALPNVGPLFASSLASSLMPVFFELRHTVQSHEIDDQGHVGNVEYLRWLQDAAVEHSAAQGWPKERYLATGAVFVVRAHQIEYLQPAFIGDEVKVVTWVSSFRKFTTVRKYQVVRERDNFLLAKAATTWAFVSWPKRLPKRCPPELVDAFVHVPEDQEPGLSPMRPRI